MKRSITKRSLIAAISVVAAADVGCAQSDRDTLAAHRLESLDGKTTTLAAYRGDVIVVNFWASWCAPCRRELPMLDQWNAAWSGRGARVIAISIDTDAKKARRFAE